MSDVDPMLIQDHEWSHNFDNYYELKQQEFKLQRKYFSRTEEELEFIEEEDWEKGD